MPIYMNITGITGGVSAGGHTGWIQVVGFEWGLGRGITTPVGNTQDREGDAPSISEIIIKKESDIASADILKKALTGDAMTVKIDFVLTGTTQLVPYYQFELTNVLISGFSMDSSGNRPIEMLSLNFTKVQFTDFEVTDKNDPGAPFRTGYDLELAQAI